MKHRFEKRILSLILCITMVLTVLITNASFAFSATYSDGAIGGSEYSEELENNIGKQVIFDWWSNFFIVDDPTREDIADIYEKTDVNSTYDDGENYWYLYEEKFYNDGTSTGQPFIDAYDVKMIITDYYYDDINGYHWYKVTGADLPEPLVEKPWVLYAFDSDFVNGRDPYLCIYDIEDTIRFVTGERPDYKVDENFEIVKDENGDPIIERINQNFYVIAGPQELAGAEITINPNYSDYPISDLACVESTNGTTFSKSYDIIIDKAVGDDVDLWTESDGLVSIRYEVAQIDADTYTEEVICGAGFLYVDDKMYSAASSDLLGNEQSDLLYTNSGTSTVVFEIMNETFEYVGETAFFANDSVTLYGNMFEEGDFLAAQLPLTFSAEYYFTYNGEEYLWLEDKGFIGSQYFIAKKDDVMYGELPEEYGDGRVSITDNKGNSVSEITLPMYEKPEFTAVSSLSQSTADVDYQWQIEYEDGKWVDIYGEDEKTIKISFGMIATLLNGDLSVNFRCETKDAYRTAYSAVIPVTLELYEYKEPDVVVSESFVTSNGETVTVSVAGDIPEDASVNLEETDSSGIEIDENETVVASLDISIKNADGTEWQPESGETVKVELPATAVGLKNGDRFVVYHLHQGEVKVLGTYTVTNGTVAFDVDGFSKFVFALAEQSIATDDLQHQVTHKATINSMYNDLWLVKDPTVITGYQNIYTTAYEGVDYVDGIVFVIADVYISEIYPYGVFYKVEALDSNNLFSAVLLDYPWVFQRYLDESDDYGTLVIQEEVAPPTEPDEPVEPEEPAEPSVGITVNGETVNEITVSKSDKVTVTATPNVEGSMTYKWQLLIPAANMWVNISGQTAADCTVNYGMVANRLDSNGQAHIRCVTTINGVEVISEPIAVNVVTTYSLFNNYWISMPKNLSVPGSRAGEESTIIYNVIIEYVFSDGSQAANPWTATIEAGGDFTGTINSPDVLGYTPDKDAVELVIVDISGDLTYTVVYQPAEVNFTVVHEFQNIYDEEYSVFKTESKTGFTESFVGDKLMLSKEEMEKEGVYDLPYDIEQKIAANGTTEVIIKYDRYYYLMTFNLGGGYGVEPIYARVGTPIAAETPIRAGYAFAGWDPELPSVMPAKDISVTAKWTAGDTSYIVVYWAENANDDNYSFWSYKQHDAVSGVEVSGSDDFNGTTELPKTGFHFDHADTNVTVKGDGSTVVNVYYKRNTYNLIFAYEDGDLICSTHVHTSSCYNINCGKTEHTHSDDCCEYGGTSRRHRSHNDNCCKLNLSEHTHNSNCYTGSPICGQTGVTNHNHSVANGCYGIKFEGIKYGQDTSAWWNQAPAYRWKTTSSGNTAYTYAPAMPNGNLTVYGQKLSSSYTYTIHYYEEGTTKTVHDDNVYYRDSSGYYLTDEDYIAIPGFKCLNSGKTEHENGVYIIYYRRQSYDLTFKNGNETKNAGKFLYEADISNQYFVPTYNGDDPEGYTFGGWYTTEKCIPGTEWVNDGATMPYNNLILYAKWVPVSHDVKLYRTKDDLADGKQYLQTISVPHNTTAEEPARPANGSYNFVGWFYMEDGVEKAYDFQIPVRKDLNLYGKWVADELADYTIKYAVKNADGSLTYIADDTKGKAVAGYDKTFDAKYGAELYNGYQTGYYPETKSHSFTVSLDDDNTYTFIYVPKEAVQYTVKYLEEGTENVLKTQKVETTRESVHTENFVFIQGYRPDAYQKRIVLSSNEAENEIIFWYKKDTEHAPVLVKHYLQNADGNGYNKTNPYLTTTDLDAFINSSYPVDIITTIQGFEFSKAEASYELNGNKTSVNITIGTTQVSAVVTQYGLLIELYYDRVDCPYEFRFLEQGTNKVLADPVKGTSIFGSQVIQSAKNIPGYTCETQNHSITIQLEDGTTAAKNVRTFYYVEEKIEIKYVPIGVGTTNPSEQANIPVLSGTVGGSTATPDAGYRFVGWFEDQACTKPVNASWISGNKITPAKTKQYGSEFGYESKTYYAKFEELNATIYYVPVGPDGVTGFGTVSRGNETVKVVNGIAQGSTAAPSSDVYKFVGWYSDAACTNKLSENATFVPTKDADKLWINGTTYYAKFEYNLTSLTIDKVFPDDADYSMDENQSFLFDVVEVDADGDVVVGGTQLRVTIHGDGQITIDGLTVGHYYKIIEKTDWSWRYSCNGWVYDKGGNGNTNVATITLGLNGTITFTNTRNEDKWLDGDSWCNNLFKTTDNQTK